MNKINPFEYGNGKVDPIQPEQWKTVELENVKPNYYFASDCGRLKTAHGKFITPTKINTGYYTFRMTNGLPYDHGRKYKIMLAHRLIKKVFDDIDEFDEMTVNHINHVKHNNCLYNLNYMTQKENNEDSINYYHVFGKEKIYNASFSDEQLIIIYNELKKGTCYKDILKLIGLPDTYNNRDYIGNIKRGKTYIRQINELKLRKLID